MFCYCELTLSAMNWRFLKNACIGTSSTYTVFVNRMIVHRRAVACSWRWIERVNYSPAADSALHWEMNSSELDRMVWNVTANLMCLILCRLQSGQCYPFKTSFKKLMLTKPTFAVAIDDCQVANRVNHYSTCIRTVCSWDCADDVTPQ
jgi:hypothetical protein